MNSKYLQVKGWWSLAYNHKLGLYLYVDCKYISKKCWHTNSTLLHSRSKTKEMLTLYLTSSNFDLWLLKQRFSFVNHWKWMRNSTYLLICARGRVTYLKTVKMTDFEELRAGEWLLPLRNSTKKFLSRFSFRWVETTNEKLLDSERYWRTRATILLKNVSHIKTVFVKMTL